MAVGLRPLPLGGGGQYVSVGPVSHTQGHVVATATSSSGGYSVAPTAEGLGQKQFADPGEYRASWFGCKLNLSLALSVGNHEWAYKLFYSVVSGSYWTWLVAVIRHVC